jgi:hypothetical protein
MLHTEAKLTKRSRTNCGIESIIEFIFTKNDGKEPESIQSHAARLKTKMLKWCPTWNGKILLRPFFDTRMTLCVYDVLKQETVRQLNVPFFPQRIVPLDKEFMLSCDMSLYVLDIEKNNCRKVFTTDNGWTITCFELLHRSRVAICVQGIVLVLNSLFKTTKTIKLSARAIKQMKNGNIATIQHKKVHIFNETFSKKLATYEIKLCHRLVELRSGHLIAYEADRSSIINLTSGKVKYSSERHRYIIELENGYHVIFFASTLMEVWNGEKCLYSVTFGIDETWEYSIREIEPGVLAWQSQELIMFYDIVNRMPVRGYPKKLCIRGQAKLRYWLME